jgi:hypothetical protein
VKPNGAIGLGIEAGTGCWPLICSSVFKGVALRVTYNFGLVDRNGGGIDHGFVFEPRIKFAFIHGLLKMALRVYVTRPMGGPDKELYDAIPVGQKLWIDRAGAGLNFYF